MKHFTVIVIGLGAMGSSTVYQLSKRKVSVLGIDQYHPPHTHGSSHGQTRITRTAIAEGIEYVPLAQRSHEIWREIERETGSDLFRQVGTLVISNTANTADTFAEKTIDAAKKYGIPGEILKGSDINSRLPSYISDEHDLGFFDSTGGYLMPEQCIASQLLLASQSAQTELHYDEQMRSFDIKKDHVVVHTDIATYSADKIVLSTGPWIQKYLPDGYRKLVRVIPQHLVWFKPKSTQFQNIPTFIVEPGASGVSFYGFPDLGDGSGVKMATVESKLEVDANWSEDASDEYKKLFVDRYVSPYFCGLIPSVVKTSSCKYTETSDSHFIIDTLPTCNRVLLVSPCSGHGFKHSAAIGEVVSDILTDIDPIINLSSFKLSRFGK